MTARNHTPVGCTYTVEDILDDEPLTLEGAAAQIDALARRLLGLERQLAAEVRTRRVVVVDEDGFERVILATTTNSADVTIAGKGERSVTVALGVDEGHRDGGRGALDITPDGHSAGVALVATNYGTSCATGLDLDQAEEGGINEGVCLSSAGFLNLNGRVIRSESEEALTKR